MPVDVSYLFSFLRHNQGQVIAREVDDNRLRNEIGWRFVFKLDHNEYALDVNGDTVTARKVSYECDFVSCIALTEH